MLDWLWLDFLSKKLRLRSGIDSGAGGGVADDAVCASGGGKVVAVLP